MASLMLTYSDLYTKVSEFLGFGSSPTGTELTKVKDIVARGYRKFLYPIDLRTGEPYTFSFAKQYMQIPTKSGSWKYPLPSDFGDMIDRPHFEADTGYRELTQVQPQQISEQRAASVSAGFPIYYGLAPFTFEGMVGTFYEMWIDPKPDGIYKLEFWYRKDPLKPENDSEFLMGGVKAMEAQLECCLAAAETQEDDEIGIHSKLAEDALQVLIRTDVKVTSDMLGNLARPKESLYRWYSALPSNDAGANVYVDDPL
jgi:hypothetical protein